MTSQSRARWSSKGRPWAQGLSAFSAGAAGSSVIDACLRKKAMGRIPFSADQLPPHVGPWFGIFLTIVWGSVKMGFVWVLKWRPVSATGIALFWTYTVKNIDMKIFQPLLLSLGLSKLRVISCHVWVFQFFNWAIKTYRTLLSNLITVVHLVSGAFLLWVETKPVNSQKRSTIHCNHQSRRCNKGTASHNSINPGWFITRGKYPQELFISYCTFPNQSRGVLNLRSIEFLILVVCWSSITNVK